MVATASTVPLSSRRIGMGSESRVHPDVAGNCLRILRITLDRKQDLPAHLLERRGIEARLGQREPQEIESAVAIAGQRLQRAAEAVEPGVEGQLHREVVLAGLEGIGVEIAGAFVEHAGEEMASPGLSDGSAAEPPSKEKLMAISGIACSSTSQAVMPPLDLTS